MSALRILVPVKRVIDYAVSYLLLVSRLPDLSVGPQLCPTLSMLYDTAVVTLRFPGRIRGRNEHLHINE